MYNIEKAMNLGPSGGLAEKKSPVTRCMFGGGGALGPGLQTTEGGLQRPLPSVGPAFSHWSKGWVTRSI